MFQLFQAHDAPTADTYTPGSRSRQLDTEGTVKFDLFLNTAETSEGIVGVLEYSTALFDAATVKRMAGHLETLLEGVVDDPAARISALPLLTAAERQQLLVEWNATRQAYPHTACIHELFEAQAATRPDAVALGVRRARPQLRAAQCARQHGRVAAAGPWGGTRSRRGCRHGTLRRARRRAPRDSEGGRRLSAARSRLPARPPRVAPEGCRSLARADPRTPRHASWPALSTPNCSWSTPPRPRAPTIRLLRPAPSTSPT